METNKAKCDRCKKLITETEWLEPCFGKYKTLCFPCDKALRNNKWYNFTRAVGYKTHYILFGISVLCYMFKKGE